MKWLDATIVSILVSSSILAQQIKLSGRLMTDGRRPIPNTRVSVAGNQGNLTDPHGRFNITLSSELKEGERVILSVEKRGWVINYPLDGEWNLPNIRLQNIQTLDVIIVPAGSKALWTHARIEKLLAKLSDELTKAKKAGEKPKPIDFSFYLGEWATKYGFTPDQVKEEFDKWSENAAKSEDDRQRGLQAFYQNNFALASKYFDNDVLKKKERLRLAEEQTNKLRLELYESLKLSGNSLMAQGNYGKALRRYEEAQGQISKVKDSKEWTDIETLKAIAMIAQSLEMPDFPSN
jgi:tetratricopeptide (TPR) repeat protein